MRGILLNYNLMKNCRVMWNQYFESFTWTGIKWPRSRLKVCYERGSKHVYYTFPSWWFLQTRKWKYNRFCSLDIRILWRKLVREDVNLESFVMAFSPNWTSLKSTSRTVLERNNPPTNLDYQIWESLKRLQT